MVLVPGEVFAGFTIEALLGRGGMGEVYRARHPRLPRQVAVKVLTDTGLQDPEFLLRFEREAALTARTNHRNIVTIFDRGVEGGRPWICMEFVDGTDVAGLLRRNRSGLPVPQALHILTQAAAGIDHAHRQGLLHRDIKPANILLAPGDPGEGERVLVSDFGIARSLDESTGRTGTGSFVATIAYAPPETFTDAPVGPRGDLYALGATLFEMLTGTVPYPRANPAAVMHAHLYEPPPEPTALRAGLPDAFDPVLARALAKDPDRRFATARELAAAATTALQEVRSPSGSATATPRAETSDRGATRPPPSAPPRSANSPGGESNAAWATGRVAGSSFRAAPPPPGAPGPTAAASVPPPRSQSSARRPGGSTPAKSVLLDRLPAGGRRWPALVAVLVVVGGLIAYEYHRVHSDFYVGTRNDAVVVFHGSPGAVLGVFTVRDVDQQACVTRSGELTLTSPGTDFPSGCLQLEVADLRASGQNSVNEGFAPGGRDQAIQQLRSLVQTELLPPCETRGAQATPTTTPVVPTAPPLGSPPTTVAPQTPGQNCRTAD